MRWCVERGTPLSLCPDVLCLIHCASLVRPDVQTALCYASPYSMLYSGSSMGLLHTWDVKHGFETSCMAGHTDSVMDLLHVPTLDQLASASLDRTIRVWDMCSGAERQVQPLM